MAEDYVFVNKKTGRKYRILEFNQDGGTVRLAGEQGIEFVEPYSKERFEKLGYTLQPA